MPPEMKWSHEMARTKTSPETAPSAAHPAPDPSPAPGTAPAAVSPAAAVHAALAANPGSAVAVIADAAGTGKPAARDALLAMEKGGTATRVKGGKPGIPDTWTLTGPAQDDAGPEDEQAGQPGGTASSPDGPRDDETAGEASQDGAAETASPGQQDADAEDSTDAEGGDGTSAAPDPEMQQPGPRDGAPAGDQDAAGGEQDDKAVPDSGNQQDPGDGGGPREDAAPEDTDGEAGDAPDPAVVSEIIERTGQIKAAADAAEQVLTASGDLKTALAGMDEIYEQAAQARRSLKAATGGRKAPAARPGGLRDKVLAHLDAHPDKEFTPHEIHKVINHSSGAIANALDTLVKHGDAEVATDKPRRFRRAAQPAGAAPEADSAEQDGTELAGAA
jgi:hypothetical protein